MLVLFNHTAPTAIYTLSLHDALPICELIVEFAVGRAAGRRRVKDEYLIAVQVGELVHAGPARSGGILAGRKNDRRDQALAHDLVRTATAVDAGNAGRGFADEQVVRLAADAVALQVGGILEVGQRGGARAIGDVFRDGVADAVLRRALPRIQRESGSVEGRIADRYRWQETAHDAAWRAAVIVFDVCRILAFARGVAHLGPGAVRARRAGQAAIDDREREHQLARLLQAPAGVLEIALLGLRGQRVQQARQHQRHHEQHDRQLDQAEAGAARGALACRAAH